MKAIMKAIQDQYDLRDDCLARGDHKEASSAHVEFHRLVYRHWPDIREALSFFKEADEILLHSRPAPNDSYNYVPITGPGVDALDHRKESDNGPTEEQVTADARAFLEKHGVADLKGVCERVNARVAPPQHS
jgi:hypothetical protein